MGQESPPDKPDVGQLSNGVAVSHASGEDAATGGVRPPAGPTERGSAAGPPKRLEPGTGTGPHQESHAFNDDGGFKGTERFRIDCQLGQGGMGTVYRAYDRARDEWVALKTLLSLDPSALYRFKREFRTLADLSHPHIVSLYELVSDAGKWFFTMELVEGVDLLTYARDGAEPPPQPVSATERAPAPEDDGDSATSAPTQPSMPPSGSAATADTVTSGEGRLASRWTGPLKAGAPCKLELLQPVLHQLAAALHVIHESGFLHRDIKPANVMVTREGRAVILDFGVVSSRSDARERYVPRFFGGTPAYLAPELLDERGEGSPASDWYALATMLYEALVGWRPFRELVPEGGKVEVLKRHHRPSPPSAFREDVPKVLDQLCLELLSPDPGDRPSGAEVLQRLGIGSVPVASISPLARIDLVGREGQLGELRRAYEDVVAGQGRVVLLRGLSGMGKSVLAQHFLGKLRDAVILEGRCYQRETVPYKALDSVVDTLFGYLLHLDRAEVDDLLVEGLSALAQVFPVLLKVDAISDALASHPTEEATTELRQRAFIALREMLARIAAKQPVVIYVDDLQWGDAESAPMLVDLMKAPSPRILLLGCYRAEEAETSSLLRAFEGEGEELEEFRARSKTLDVGKIAPGEAAILAESLVEEGAQGRVPRIVQEAQGNPYLIQELARYANRLDADGQGEMTLDGVLRARIDEMAQAGQRLLEVIAVAGTRLLQSVARRAAEGGGDQRRLIAELRAAHLVRTTGSGEQARIECYHDRVREVITASMSEEKQRFWHERIADALHLVVDEERADHIYELAHHAYLGDAPKREQWIFDLNVRAGQLAARAFAFEEAHHFLTHAADVAERGKITPDPDFDQLYAEVSSATGRVQTAVLYCERALARSEQPLQRAAIRNNLAKIYVSAMDPAGGRREALAGLRELGRPVSKSTFIEIIRTLWNWRKGRAIERDPKRFGSATEADRPRYRTEVALRLQACMACYFALRPIDFVLNSLATYRPSALLGLCREYVELYMSMASISGARRMPWAGALLLRTEELVEALDHMPMRARVQAFLSFVEHFLGRTTSAAKRARRALAEYGRWLDNADYFTVVADLSWNLLMRGYPQEGWRWVQHGLQRAALAGDSNALVQGHTYRCYAGPLLTMRGNHEAGNRHLEYFRSTLRAPERDPWRWGQYLGHKALAMLLEGKLGDAFERTLAQHRELGFTPRKTPLQLSHVYVAAAYARLWHYQQASVTTRRSLRRPLKRAIRALRRAFRQETLICHRLVVEAEFFREEGKVKHALANLDQAEAIAEQTDNRWVRAECAISRARHARRAGDESSFKELRDQGLSFFDAVGWEQRASQLRRELG